MRVEADCPSALCNQAALMGAHRGDRSFRRQLSRKHSPTRLDLDGIIGIHEPIRVVDLCEDTVGPPWPLQVTRPPGLMRLSHL